MASLLIFPGLFIPHTYNVACAKSRTQMGIDRWLSSRPRPRVTNLRIQSESGSKILVALEGKGKTRRYETLD